MQRRSSIPRLVVLLLSVGSIAAAPNYIRPVDVDWKTILGDPPAEGSDVEKQEIATLLDLQSKRTQQEVARCKLEGKVDPFVFADVLGEKFTPRAVPLTAKLLRDISDDLEPFVSLTKAKWARKRPPIVDPRIQYCVHLETNGSFPSAHAMRGVVWSIILSDIFPAKKTELLARGILMGQDRLIAGMHFPSDVMAGQKLGGAIADKLMTNPAFAATVKAAKAECEDAHIVD